MTLMSWEISSLIMFIASVCAYLCVRNTKELKLPNALVNLANFIIPALVFFTILISTGTSFNIRFEYLILIMIFAVIGNYLGSIIGLNAMKLSSNPGFSLIIQKSYAPFTAVASYFMFASELSIKNFIAIIVIIFFVLLMGYERSKDKNDNRSFINKKMWIILSLIACLIWGANALFAKYLIVAGVDIYVRLFYITLFTSLTSIFEITRQKIKIDFNKKNILTLLGVGIFFTFFYIFMQKAYEVAPNIGYVNVINTSSITALTILSTIFFKDKLTAKMVISVIGVTLGVILILI